MQLIKKDWKLTEGEKCVIVQSKSSLFQWHQDHQFSTMEPMDDFMVMRRQLLSNSSDLVDTSISTSEFVTNLEVSIPVGVILILLYCLIRWYRPTLYEVRRTFAQVMALEEDHDSIDLAKERRDSQSKSQFIGQFSQHKKHFFLFCVFLFILAQPFSCVFQL